MANRMERKNAFFFKIVTSCALILAGLMAVTFWRLLHPQEPKYYQIAVDAQGQKQYLPLQFLSGRLFSREMLLLWVQEVVADVYTFNGVNYQQKFNSLLSTDFTSNGATSFRQVLNDSQLLKQVVTQQLNLTGIVSGQPVILQQGYLLGRYSWKVQMPVLLTFESASNVTTKQVIVTVLAVAVPSTQSPNTVAIDQFWSQE
jgi:intracellular multiplication protein IcmL